MKLPRYLQVLLVMTLLLVGVMFWRDRQTTDDDLAPVRMAARRASSARDAEPAAATSVAIAAVPERGRGMNLFPPQSWRPPPPPAPTVAAVASKPPPPSVPFTVTGEWRYLGEQPIVMLQRNGGQTYVLCATCDLAGRIRPGERIGTDYRLDEIGDRTLKLTYLPMHHPYTLSFGAR